MEARQKRSRAKTAAGLPGQALSALTSDGLAPHGPDTLAKLKGKHPTAAPPTASASSPLRNTSGPADFTPKEVLAAISSMPRATAGGPSNLTGSLLRTLCNQKHTPGTLAALSAVLSSLAQGKARREVAPFFAGAKLVALRKVSKGIVLSRKGLLQHMRRHQADGAYIPDELLGHLGMSRCANDQCDMLLPQSKEVCNTCTVHFGEEGFTAPSPSSRGMLTDQDDLPSFEVMGTTRIQLKGGCPDKHLQLYSELFLRVLMDILEYQDEVAWKRLALKNGVHFLKKGVHFLKKGVHFLKKGVHFLKKGFIF